MLLNAPLNVGVTAERGGEIVGEHDVDARDVEDAGAGGRRSRLHEPRGDAGLLGAQRRRSDDEREDPQGPPRTPKD